LKYLGFDSNALSVVFHALIMSRILYGIPSFAGRLTQTDKNRINKILHKSYKRGFVCADYDIDNLVSDVDSKLFRAIRRYDHVLNSLLPPLRSENVVNTKAKKT
jgi:hypothetical protein